MSDVTKTLSQIPALPALANLKTLIGTNTSDKDVNIAFGLIETYINNAISTAVSGISGGSSEILLLEMETTNNVKFTDYEYTYEGMWTVTTFKDSADASFSSYDHHITVTTPGIYKVTLIARTTSVDSSGTSTSWPNVSGMFLGTRLPGATTIPLNMEASLKSVTGADFGTANFMQWTDEYYIEIDTAGQTFMPGVHWKAYNGSNMRGLFKICAAIERVSALP